MLAHGGSDLGQAESVGECSRESRADTISMFEKATSSEIFFTRLCRVGEKMLCVSKLSDVWPWFAGKTIEGWKFEVDKVESCCE